MQSTLFCKDPKEKRDDRGGERSFKNRFVQIINTQSTRVQSINYYLMIMNLANNEIKS